MLCFCASPGCRGSWILNSELRAPVCQNRIGTFGMTPDSLMDLWCRKLIDYGSLRYSVSGRAMRPRPFLPQNPHRALLGSAARDTG